MVFSKNNLSTSYNMRAVVQVYNPRYSGGRDQEDCGSKPPPANSSGDPISKKLITKKKNLVEWLKV
jgi:hypothetical protein